MAIKDAAVLGILFSPAYFTGNVAETLEVYQEVCLLRATKVQSASAKAAYNINERIGEFSPHPRRAGEVGRQEHVVH